MKRNLDVLILADIHYVHKADHICKSATRKASLGLELVTRVVQEIERGEKPDVIVVMGDLVDNGEASGTEEDLYALKTALENVSIPILVVPGNHDGSPERILRMFGDRPGVHEINGYVLITFVEHYDAEDKAARSPQGLALVKEAASTHPDQPILVFQHNPVYPPIESTYPYNLTNSSDVMANYASSNVLLSVSGHLHPGHPLCYVDRVGYVIAPALCEAPFRWLRIRVQDRQVDVQEIALKTPEDPLLWDTHVHTQYAYCATTVEVRAAIERAQLLGLAGLAFAEHAGQLYLSKEDYWAGRAIHEPDLFRRQRQAGLDRMKAYRAEMEALRAPSVKLGLEVECDRNGELTLLEEDREGWDFLIGAVHWLPENLQSERTVDIEQGFMEVTECLLKQGVHVLAHPFRYFVRHKMRVPRYLFCPMAQLLAEYGVAAEINFHTNTPNPEFFQYCLEEGVLIAFGSDAHALYEVGALHSNLKVFQQAGGKLGQEDSLFVPNQS